MASWRQTVDSFGGFLTIGAVGAAIVVVAVLVWHSPLRSTSEEPLRGEAIAIGPATHIADPALVQPQVAGAPPVGGPHFATPQEPGIYDQPVTDGNAVHSLEHGIVWISYNASLVDAKALDQLKSITGDHRRDVILSPRPANTTAVAVASWGRLLRLDRVDTKQIRDFITTNLNRAPEPGVR